jgi:hypothetical protein
MNYITVLDFEAGRVFQYDLKSSWLNLDIQDGYVRAENVEELLTNKGHNLSNCEWMQHENPQVVTN